MFLVFLELVCRRCARTEAGRFTMGAIPRKTMRHIAESRGWEYKTTTYGKDWFCGNCKHKSDDEE